MTMMICPKADSCQIKCDAKFPHERNQFCEEECGVGYIVPCNIYNAPVDVTLQDFSALLKKRANALTPAERMSAFMLGANAAQAIIDKQEGRPMPKMPPMPIPDKPGWC